MGSVTAATCLEPSGALRRRSAEQLRASLADYLVAAEPTVEIDWRDVLVGMAPFHDCAKRLGVDPVPLFDAASKDLGAGARDLARRFARESDVDLQSFGWALIETPEGPCYRPVA
jgi:hypothetical protein